MGFLVHRRNLEGRGEDRGCEACERVLKAKERGAPNTIFTTRRELGPQGMRQLPVHARPDQMQPALPCSSHLPRHLFHPHNLHQSQIRRNRLCPVSTNQSLAGWPTPLPSSCFEAAYNHSSQGRWVMWSGGFSCDIFPLLFRCRLPSWPQPPCLYRKQWLLTWPRSPYLHPLICIHFAALDQLNAERLL